MCHHRKQGRHEAAGSRPGAQDGSVHEGERLAHRLFGVEDFWKDHDFSAMFRASIPKALPAFLESLPFFFIATSNSRGECDCSYRGRDMSVSGKPHALVKVLDETTLIFPDYPGNNFFNSLGNILVNGHIGMLFIDFESRIRVRINGRARIVVDQSAYAKWWPSARRYVQVTVEQVYGNCRARIPLMELRPRTGPGHQDG
jgi:predicted pyridoxine 5'-phosphate oxidase superfamily flavin-nucleotide-binding protein